MLYHQVKHTFLAVKQTAPMKTIGGRIRQRRQELKLTQSQLSKPSGITKMAVSDWENDKTIPTGPNLVSCAATLKVHERWLTEGRGPKERGTQPSSAVPLIDMVQAGAWTESGEGSVETAEVFLVPSRPVSARAFALKITGRSMTPEFYPGDDIIVDPEVKPGTGDYVVAKRDKDNEATFKKVYFKSHGDAELRPINTDEFKALKLDEMTPGHIVGVMVEHRKYRRS